MARGSLVFSTRVPGADKLHAFTASGSDRMDRAAREATKAATQSLGHFADAAIARIAGGVYWDVKRDFNATPRGGIGRVVTGPNRPHIIRPRPGNPRGVLSFRVGGGRWVSVKEVNHPGANPVNWPDGLGGFTEIARAYFENEVQQVEAEARGAASG